jgi:hypothetical protein
MRTKTLPIKAWFFEILLWIGITTANTKWTISAAWIGRKKGAQPINELSQVISRITRNGGRCVCGSRLCLNRTTAYHETQCKRKVCKNKFVLHLCLSFLSIFAVPYGQD